MKHLRFPLLILGFFHISLPVQARHIIAGDITYKYVGSVGGTSNRYTFTMTLYRDCTPLNGAASFDNPAELAIYKIEQGDTTLFESFSAPINQQLDIPLSFSLCWNTQETCVERAVYEFERILPFSGAPDYILVYQRCCRTASITNIAEPGNAGMTIFVQLSAKAQMLHNNSPQFSDYPSSALCIHEPASILNAATDQDGDLLSYHFCNPFNGGGPVLTSPELFTCEGAVPTPPCSPPYAEINFISPPFSTAHPIPGDPEFSINASSGLITGTPTMIGYFLASVCVDEYKNGILLSSIHRDFLLPVGDFVSTSEAQSAPAQAEVWPNPFRGSIELNILETAAPEGEFRLYDQTGRLVWSQKTNAQRTEINTQTLPAGLYNWEWMGRDLVKSRGKLNKI